MGNPKGFLEEERLLPKRRPVEVRIMDWKEVYEPFDKTDLKKQAGRCMDCGIPFCHNGCPLGNLIPEFNDLVYRDAWESASDRLHATNNFPEFTGRLCPAPCESACVVAINSDAVTIKQVEVEIANRAFEEGWIKAQPPDRLSGKTVAIVGSGPAGLAAAQQLARVGHTVAVYEKAQRPGGLLRYGIPEFKMEKRHLDARIAQLEDEGVRFRCGIELGIDVTLAELNTRYDAVILAIGATNWRGLNIEGSNLKGVYQAMEYLPHANRFALGEIPNSPIDVAGKQVVIIGGGDTGADCLGTAHRQGAAKITQLEIMPEPTVSRSSNQPWPLYPNIFRVSSAHEEGGEREYSVNTRRFLGEAGKLTGLEVETVEFVNGKFTPVENSLRVIPADFVFLAMGFTGPDLSWISKEISISQDERSNIARNEVFQTNHEGIFVCGDAGRGQSLIVWAIAEGRSCARYVDEFLMGTSQLPAPIGVFDRPLSLSR
ncbi:MAG: glutamate synthase subunit beta [Candidatus Nanopelagicales bacterium]